MAKVSFKNLGLKVDQGVKVITFNEQEIEVKQYLPVNDKLHIIENVINKLLGEGNNFINPVKMKVYLALEVLYNYTNINFTDKQKEDEAKLYDMVVSSGLLNMVVDNILGEYNDLSCGVYDTVSEIYKYNNSAMGIMEQISQNYSNLNIEASELQKKIADPNNLTLLKDIIEKLG